MHGFGICVEGLGPPWLHKGFYQGSKRFCGFSVFRGNAKTIQNLSHITE